MPDVAFAQDYVLALCTEADLDAVEEVERLSSPAPWSRQAFTDELARPWARLAILRHAGTGRVVAFSSYWIVADELQILNVAVHPAERRRGHAARFLRHILEEAKRARVRVLSLEVRVSNQPAVALYRKLGFREVGVRPRYYANREDALLMDLEVAP